MRTRFDAELRRNLPQFSAVTGQTVRGGDRLYRWEIGESLYGFVYLQMGSGDEFTVEVGWSSDGLYPFGVLPGFPVDFPALGIRKDKPDTHGFRCRLVKLWDPRRNAFWELVPRPPLEEALDRLELISQGIQVDPPVDSVLSKVEPAVDDAIRHIVSHAVPYLLQISE